MLSTVMKNRVGMGEKIEKTLHFVVSQGSGTDPY